MNTNQYNNTKAAIQTELPKIVVGTSGLGNLYVARSEATKCEIVKGWITYAAPPLLFDSAGKYGAGQALESLGNCLKALSIQPEDVLISNKLGWYRIPLTAPEPTFEPGVWKDIKYDAEQRISYQGILDCYEQGNELLGNYDAQLVSVHDPDEYLAAATTENDRHTRFNDIKEAYRALFELKEQGKVKAIGVGAKDWQIIKKITDVIDLDWVMIANSMTLQSHPADLWTYMQTLKDKGTAIINSAVFNGGFLVGGDFYNYHAINPELPSHQQLLEWRKSFFALCEQFNVKPAHACVQFGLSAPGVQSIALSTTNIDNVKPNVDMATIPLPQAFWKAMREEGLMSVDFSTEG